MVNLSHSLRREIAGLPPGEFCCARWELATILAALGRTDGALRVPDPLLVGRLQALASVLGLELVVRQPGLGPALASLRSGNGPSEQLLPAPARPAGGMRRETSVAGRTAGPGRAPGPASRLRRCCRGAVLRGAVWRGAYLGSEGHLEFASTREAFLSLLGRTRIPFHRTRRRGCQVLYLKEQDAIAETAGLMGAFETMLAIEDLLVTRRMRNDINRAVNCEVGNLSRTGRSAAALLEEIERLRAASLLEALPPRLQEVAGLRSRHPAASIAELAGHARPPVTKSGMQHRLAELAELAAELRKRNRL